MIGKGWRGEEGNDDQKKFQQDQKGGERNAFRTRRRAGGREDEITE